MERGSPRVVLLDPDETARRLLASRLTAQSFHVEPFGDPLEAADHLLTSPPDAVIADVWMPGISGVQLTRLLRLEPATEHLPVILRADGDEPKPRFWAEQAGAAAFVPRGRIGDLVRALRHSIAEAPESDGFFTSMRAIDLRNRIYEHLDQALFESVIASSVRALGTCESFSRLFDLFSQFVCRTVTYRWLGLWSASQGQLAVHCHPETRANSESSAIEILGAGSCAPIIIEDGDASLHESRGEIISVEVTFGNEVIGKVAVLPIEQDDDSDIQKTIELIAREVGGPLKVATLVEQSQRLAAYDPLTGIMNRRAFVQRLLSAIKEAVAQDTPLSFVLLDVDHFKSVNDTHGHKAGDEVLTELGRIIPMQLPEGSSVARWGGEEFVVAFSKQTPSEALATTELLRQRIEDEVNVLHKGKRIPITVSCGLASLSPDETLEILVERADRAMYAAKLQGRNRVRVAPDSLSEAPATSRRFPAPVSVDSEGLAKAN